MSILIQLFRADVDCLLLHLPPDSGISQKLEQSRKTVHPLGPPKSVNCSESEAAEMLRVAREHCPEAVEEILISIALCVR